jgi:hypothetical protein
VDISGSHLHFKIAVLAKQGFPYHWKFSKVHTSLRFAHGFQPSVCIPLCNKIVQAKAEVIQNHENEHDHSIGQGEARHRKYKTIKLGGGQVYDRLSNSAAIVA